MTSMVLRILFFVLSFSVVVPFSMAQSGITVYSDTTDSALDSDVDSAYQSIYSFPSYPDPAGVWEDVVGSGLLGFLSSLLGLTGGLLILIALIFVLFPFIAIGLIVYLAYALHREKKRNNGNGQDVFDERPKDKATQDLLLKEKAIRLACWGMGIVIVNFVAFKSTFILIVGVVLLCIAAADWLITIIRRGI